MKPRSFFSVCSILLACLCMFSMPRNVDSLAVMSVDLGSEWMKIAIVSPGVPMEIILNTDSQRKTPLAIAFRDGERFVGDSALNVGVRFPEKTFTHFIDLLGKRNFQSISVQKYQERFPYHTLVETDSGQIAFVLKDNGQETLYTPEELLSMLLSKARHFAELASASSSPTGQTQTITDCVLTVPPYFSQTERRATKLAASLAGLKVLQLMNTNTAFALNYGVFRRKDFNTSQPTNILFYDMGAGSTVSSIISYQLVKTKERGFTETNPLLTVKGVGFDRYLGGFELQLRLRDHLLKLFSEQSKKTIQEIRKNKRAMSKLLKEAGRLKKVLSANTEHKAQIENVMNDIDLKAIVTREQFETMADDLLNQRVTKPLDDVFKSSGLTLGEIDSFIIIGGATRIPKVQQMLESFISRELSKNLNADEAGALGAAYQAAHLSKAFKVKTFHVKDANLYDINVDFDRIGETDKKRPISRVLFGIGNVYPQKKVITFSKHKEDFDFVVNYANVVPQDSEKNICKVSLKEIAPLYTKYDSNSSVDPKGIKVHFKLDESGLFSIDDCEALFEVQYEELIETDKIDQLRDVVGDAISKFGNTISNLFSSNEQTNDTEKIVNATTDNQESETQPNNTQTSNSSEQLNVTNASIENKGNITEKELKKEIKKKIVKEKVIYEVDLLDQKPISDEIFSSSKEKLKSLDEKEVAKLKRDQSKNNLESFISETRDKLEQEEYLSASTEEERTKIETELRTSSEWLEYESDGADATVLDEKINNLRVLFQPIFDRVREHRERPEALAALRNILNISDLFHTSAANASVDEQVFSEVELTNLRKLIDDTQTWLTESETEQASLPTSVTPTKLTLQAIAEKISTLDREVKYLLNKARVTPPKKKPKQEEPKTEEFPNQENNSTGPKDENVTTQSEQKVEEQPEEVVTPEKLDDVPPKTEL